jgi:two-component system KDP operon response regulator KdpE
MTESPHPPTILVVDDEEAIRRFLRATLHAHGYRVEEAGDARQGLLRAGQHPPDLILLDLGLPDGDGIAVTREVRTWSNVPIVVISAREREADKVAALDAGADDYVTKPFGVDELLARIRVALRHAAQRQSGKDDPVYVATSDGRTLRVDLARRQVAVRDGEDAVEVKLTPTAYRLLAELVKHAGKVLTHAHLLREVWGPTHVHDLQYLRVYASQLRQRIERDGAHPRFLLTEPGVGYRLLPPDPPPT